MTAEVIEGEAIEVEPVRAVVVAQPGQALVTSTDDPLGPQHMIERASALATALSQMVERQRLFTVIQGKRYPQVEAWQTIGRLDNVVAREAATPVRNDDGSWEATVELVRLSDGMVIGNGSAICGDPQDRPWNSRADYQKRSMAVTRATSRAFRQQYAWIMALAGYEPTPADEMPHEAPAAPMRPELEKRAEGLIGEVKAGASPVDLNLRETPDGPIFGFKLMAGRKGFQCVAEGDLAQVLAMAGLTEGTRATVYGSVESVPWEKDGKSMPPYSRIHLERVATPDWTLPTEPPDDVPLVGERSVA